MHIGHRSILGTIKHFNTQARSWFLWEVNQLPFFKWLATRLRCAASKCTSKFRADALTVQFIYTHIHWLGIILLGRSFLNKYSTSCCKFCFQPAKRLLWVEAELHVWNMSRLFTDKSVFVTTCRPVSWFLNLGFLFRQRMLFRSLRFPWGASRHYYRPTESWKGDVRKIHVWFSHYAHLSLEPPPHPEHARARGERG